MDFAFAPARDTHNNNLRAMFARRATTTVVDDPRRITTLRQFIAHLDTTRTIPKPVGDLVLGMHANDEGQLFIPMFPGQRGPTTFETLEESLTDPKKSVAIPDTLIDFKPGNAVTHALHLKGCNVGQALPFLTKLKAVLGGHVKVTAPKFFHGATPTPEGSFEYMGYEFAVKRSTPFVKRADVLAAFDNEGFTLIDGSTVPTADWNTVIPADISRTSGRNVRSQLGTPIGSRTTLNTPRQFRALEITFGPWVIRYPNAAAVPKNKSQQESDLESNLGADPRFQSTHPYPQYEREGFPRVIEFVSGYTWQCSPRGNTLVCFGRRMLYVVALGITDPATVPTSGTFADGHLIFNFYPAATSSLPARTTALLVTDPKFFATV